VLLRPCLDRLRARLFRIADWTLPRELTADERELLFRMSL
jgi:hypothetical protein